MRIFAIAVAMALSLGAPLAWGIGDDGATLGVFEGPNGNASPEDIEFLRHASVVALAINQLGELGIRNGNSPNAMTAGRQAQQRYGPVEDNLLRWARHKGMGELYRTLDPEEYTLMRKLKAAKSDDFDNLFMTYLLQTQEKLTAMFRKESETGRDVDIKGYSKVEIPNLEQYAKATQGMANEMRAASSK